MASSILNSFKRLFPKAGPSDRTCCVHQRLLFLLFRASKLITAEAAIIAQAMFPSIKNVLFIQDYRCGRVTKSINCSQQSVNNVSIVYRHRAFCLHTFRLLLLLGCRKYDPLFVLILADRQRYSASFSSIYTSLHTFKYSKLPRYEYDYKHYYYY